MRDSILIVDDNLKLCRSLAENLYAVGYDCRYTTCPDRAIELIRNNGFSIVLLDIVLGRASGIELLKQINSINRELPVIMITGFATIDSAVQSLKSGAFDYIQKPLDFDRLLDTIEKTKTQRHRRTDDPGRQGHAPERSPRIVTCNPALLSLLERATKLAAADLPVLILGENGTGKELIADFIHAHSARFGHPLIKINCGAFAESLLDSELFGYEKGAFTGADSAFQGVFEEAHQGMLFLDEIGNMHPALQVKMLRAIQNQEIKRIGGNSIIHIDVRFISATNCDLLGLISAGRFREDLYYRINTAMLTLPPLRERKEDIALLAQHFLNEYACAHGCIPKKISEMVLEQFLDYDWPGNIRELKNAVLYASAVSSRDCIEREDLPPNLLLMRKNGNGIGIREELEKNLIQKTLYESGGNKRRAAAILRMSRNTLYCRMKKYGIEA